jgi:hypothetical protein
MKAINDVILVLDKRGINQTVKLVEIVLITVERSVIHKLKIDDRCPKRRVLVLSIVQKEMNAFLDATAEDGNQRSEDVKL